MYEQETQIMAAGFIQGQHTYITMIVACIVANNQGWLVFMVWCLTKLIPYTMRVSRQKSFVLFVLFYMSMKLFHIEVQALFKYGFKRKYEGFCKSFFSKVCVYNLL